MMRSLKISHKKIALFLLVICICTNSCVSTKEFEMIVPEEKNNQVYKSDRQIDVNDICNKQTSKEKESEQLDCRSLKFRYFMIVNALHGEKIRRIDIFMEPSAFSETNLNKLFTMFSKTFTKPEVLIIELKTNWNQFHFSRAPNCPGVGFTSQSATEDQRKVEKNTYKYHYALFRRKDGVEYYTYNKVLNKYPRKRVILKDSRK